MENNSKDKHNLTETPGANGRSQLLQAAGIVAAATLISRILGLVRDIITKIELGGSTMEATAYELALTLPEAIFFIVAGGAIASAFIPTFAAYFTRDDEKGAWHLFSAVINLLTIATIIISGLAMVFAAPIVTFFRETSIAADSSGLLLPTTVRLFRIMLITPIIFGASGVIMGTLNARRHFLLPAIAPILYNLGIILGGLLIDPPELGLALGTVIGALAHLLIQLPGLKQNQARYTPVLTVRDPGVRRVLRLMAPRMLGLSFSQINKLVIAFFTDAMAQGSLVAMNIALRLMLLPQGVIGQALGIASFPTLADLANKGDLRGMRRIVSDTLRLILFLSLPIMILFIMLGRPLITILFQYGRFESADTDLAAWALLFYAIGLVALVALEVINRAFYSLGDTLTPVVAGGVQIILMLGLSLLLRDQIFPALSWEPLGGLALGWSLSNFFEVGLLLWLLQRKMEGLNGSTLLDSFWRIGIASLGMTAAIGGFGVVWPDVSVWVQFLGGTAVGVLTFILLSGLLRVREVQMIIGYGRRLLRK